MAQTMRHSEADTYHRVRAGMAVLAGIDAIVGGWALLAPRAFHDYFPGGPFRWISPFGEYNTHLIADIGGAYLMMTTLLLLGIWFAERRVIQVVLISVLAQAVLHLAWHLIHLSMLPDPVNRAGLLTALTVAVALPAALLPATRQQASG